MTVAGRVAPANPVPAAAVKRGGRVLFALTGRKVCVGIFLKGTRENLGINP